LRTIVISSIVRLLPLLCCLAVSPLQAGDDWSLLSDDKYALEYVKSPIFKKVGPGSPSAADEVIIRISSISSWGVGVTEVSSRARQVRVERYRCSGSGQEVEGGKMYNLVDHRVKIIEDPALVAEARGQLTDPALLDFLRTTAQLKGAEDTVIDGSNLLVEVCAGGKAELIYVRGPQLAARAKEMPAILLTGILGRTRD
jgi:hypothetical protein